MDFRNYLSTNESRISAIDNKESYGSPKDPNQSLHWHPHYEVMIVYQSGKYTLTNNSKKIVTDRPAVYIHRPYTLHLLETHDDSLYSRSVTRFDKAFLSGFSHDFVDFSALTAADLTCVYPNAEELSEMRTMSEMISDSAVRLHDRVLVRLQVAQLLRRIAMIYESGRGESFSGALSYIQEVMRTVAENLSEPITIAELAERFGVGQSKFYADFRRQTGSTYKKYLTDLRMTRARELLTSGSSIIDVSLETGYSSEAHFIATYKSYWGVTPGSRDKVRSKSEK